ncbi:hypothetical protein EDD85DRAFT_784163 [Armillaria nabsnona]|nr:hypothetical protein EDD85DRAFT_784163 [Armillaria nabsnona]
MKPAPLPVPVKGKKAKMMTQPSIGQSSNKKSKLPIKTMKNPVKIVTPPLQQSVHRFNHPCKLVSSDNEDAVAIHHQQQGSEDEEENDSEAEEMVENQDMDSQRLGKRKRSPSAHGLTPPKLVKNFSALKKYYRLASCNIPRFIHPWANVQGIVLHGFMVKGIIELLAEDEKDDTEDDSDSEMKEPKTPDQLEDPDLDDPLSAIFEILGEINAGAHSGCLDDTTKISDNIMHLSTKDLTDDTLLPTLKKYQHGFNHIHTARLLFPQCWTNKFDEDPHAMMVKLQTKWSLLRPYLHLGSLFKLLTCTVKGKLNLKTALEEMIVYAAVQVLKPKIDEDQEEVDDDDDELIMNRNHNTRIKDHTTAAAAAAAAADDEELDNNKSNVMS